MRPPCVGLSFRRTLIGAAFVGLVAAVSLLLTDPVQRKVIGPSLVVFGTAVAFVCVIWDRQGFLPLLDIGVLFMLALACYSLIPFLGYLFSGMEYTRFSAAQLRVHPPGPDVFAAIAWRYVVFIVCFAAVHLAVRGSKPLEIRALCLPRDPVPAAVILLLALFWMGFALLKHYGLDFDPSYASDASLVQGRFRMMPLLSQQILQNLYKIRLGLRLALVAVLIRYWTYPWARVLLLGWVTLFVAGRVFGLQGRTDMAALLLAFIVLYHTYIRRIHSSVLIAGGLVGLVLFMAIPIVRNQATFGYGLRDLGHWFRIASPQTHFSRSNEFQNGFAGTYDLYRLREAGLLPPVPWQVRAADVLVLLPRQILPFEKTNPQHWWRSELADTAGFFMFNPIGQAILGLDWMVLVLRGSALGLFFGVIHCWYARHCDRFWAVWPYLWLAVFCYSAIRTTTFILIYWIVYRIVPIVIIVWLTARCLGCVVSRLPPAVRAAIVLTGPHKPKLDPENNRCCQADDHENTD